MTRYLRDNVYQPPGLQLWDPVIPDLRARPPRLPAWVPPTENTSPFGSPPPSPPPSQLPDFELWNKPSTPGLKGTPQTPPAFPPWPLPPTSPPGGKSPFVDPPSIPLPQKRPPRDVDPSDKNPYNDPDFNPNFLVTKNHSGQLGDETSSGLLGMLRTMMQQGQVQSGADSISTPNDASEYTPDNYGTPQGGSLGRLLALHDEQVRNAADVYGSGDVARNPVARTYASQPQELATASQKPVRILSRRLVR